MTMVQTLQNLKRLMIKNEVHLATSFILIALALVLSSCSVTEIKDTEGCAVAGRLSQGADCFYSLSDKTETMDFQSFIEFLEPAPATKTTPEKGAAICIPASDYTKIKITMETACYNLGDMCTTEIKQAIQTVDKQEKKLQDSARSLMNIEVRESKYRRKK